MKKRLVQEVAALSMAAVLMSALVFTALTVLRDPTYAADISSAVSEFQLSATHEGGEQHRSLSAAAHSLFGSLYYINSTDLIISLIIVTFIVLFVEYLFHTLHLFTEDSPFHKVITALEKELMIVGCTAFLFKIVINVTHFLTPDWFFALEFSDLLIPIFSFTNCIIGLLLIIMSLLQCDTWSKAYHMTIEEVLMESMDDNGNSLLE